MTDNDHEWDRAYEQKCDEADERERESRGTCACGELGDDWHCDGFTPHNREFRCHAAICDHCAENQIVVYGFDRVGRLLRVYCADCLEALISAYPDVQIDGGDSPRWAAYRAEVRRSDYERDGPIEQTIRMIDSCLRECEVPQWPG